MADIPWPRLRQQGRVATLWGVDRWAAATFHWLVRTRTGDFLVLFALVLFVYQGWFKPGIITYVDLFYPPAQWVAEKVAIPYAWSSEHGGYYGGLWQAVQYYLYFLQGFLVKFGGLGIDTAMRVVWLIPFIFISIPGMYYLAHVLFNRRFISFLAAASFPLSTMLIFTNHQGFGSLTSTVALNAWVAAFFYRSLRHRRLRDAVIAGLFLGAGISYDIKIAILGGGLVLFFAVYYLVTESPLAKGQGLGWREVRFLAISTSIVALVGFSLHLQSLLPAVFSGALVTPRGSEEPAWVQVTSQNTILNALMLSTDYWLNRAQLVPWAALGIAALAFAAPILRPRDRGVALLALLALLLLFMIKGSKPPFEEFYIWLYAHIPGFVAFRDTQKFVLVLVIPYTLLFAVTADTLGGLLCRWGRPRLIRGTIIFLALALILWTNSPTFIGPNAYDRTNLPGSSFKPHPMPEEYQRLYQWLETLPPDQGLMVSPHNAPYLLQSERNFGISNHWHVVLGSFYDFGRYFAVTGYGHWSIMERRLTRNIGSLLGLANVGYVVIKPKWEVTWASSTMNMPDFVLQGYEEQQDLTRLPEFKEAAVFKNEKFLPRLYVPSRAAAVVGGRNTLLSLALLEADFSRWALFYPGLVQDGFMGIWDQMDTVIFSDKGLDDLVLSSVDRTYRIDLFPYAKAVEKGMPSEQRGYDHWDPNESGWLRVNSQYWDTKRGEVFESQGALVQGGSPMARLAVPWTAKEAGTYEVWLRLGVGHDIEFLRNIGAVSVHLDRSLVGYLSSYSPDFVGLRWVRAGTVEAAAGEHLVDLFNRADMNTLDELIIIPQKALTQHDARIRSALPSKTLIHLREGEKSFVRENINWSISDKYGAAASQGYVLTTSAPQESAAATLELAARDDYRLALRAAGEGFTGRVTIAVDDREVLATSWEGRPQGQMLWLETNPLPLIAGPHKVKVSKAGSGAFYLDLLVAHNTRSPVEELWRPKAAGPALTWETVNPTEYKVELKTVKPTFLLMPLNYNALWHAEVEGKNSPSLKVNTYGNAFLIDNPKGEKITLRFAAQRWTELGLYLSLTAMAGLAGYLLATSGRGRRMIEARWRRREIGTYGLGAASEKQPDGFPSKAGISATFVENKRGIMPTILWRLLLAGNYLLFRTELARIRIGKRTINYWIQSLVLPFLLPALKEKVVTLETGAKFIIPAGFLPYRTTSTASYEKEVTDVFMASLRPGMVVVDLGANIGYYTLIASKLVGPSGRVFAFEPDEKCYGTLMRNLAVNAISNVTLVKKAVSNKPGRMTFSSGPVVVLGGGSLHAPNKPNEIWVDVTSLDDYFSKEGWPRIDLIKMDIEGAEYAALRGMRDLCDRNPSLKLIMEFNVSSMRWAGVKPEDLCSLLEELRFGRILLLEEGQRQLDLAAELPWLSKRGEYHTSNWLCEKG